MVQGGTKGIYLFTNSSNNDIVSIFQLRWMVGDSATVLVQMTLPFAIYAKPWTQVVSNYM